MLFLNTLLALNACLQHSQLQYVAGLLVQHQLAGTVVHVRDVVLAHLVLQFRLDGLCVDVKSAEQVDDRSVLHAQQPQQQVLRPYGAACQSGSFFAGKGKYLRYLR